MRTPLRIITVALALSAMAQANRRDPQVGYLYPAGGRQGTTVWIVAGGQLLRGVSDIHVTGGGIEMVGVRYGGRFRFLNGDQRQELKRRIDARREALGMERKGRKIPPPEEPVAFPDHPLLKDVMELSLRELDFVEGRFLRVDRGRQLNNQIGEVVLLEVAIDPDATPGDRELRLRSPLGLSNPICFQVGTLPEIREPEPYDIRAGDPEPVDLPVLINGQIKPGDVDRFAFRARKGQRLVVEARARHLIPYLADAVPGWFQAVLTLLDADGNELAFEDDYRLGPDPVIFHEIPADGVYKIEIRDSIWRGREDFVYRIAAGELPFIRSIFPLGARLGSEADATVEGWNLPDARMRLTAGGGKEGIRTAAVHREGASSNPVTYAVDDLPDQDEAEPNDTLESAPKIQTPTIINGRIGSPTDVDTFRIHCGHGDEIVAEVLGRRLGSPLDSMLRVIDSKGDILAWNDDHMEKDGHLHTGMGLITHYADSYIRIMAPRRGTYYVQIADSQNNGGEAYAYRLRIAPPRPDFALRVTPSSLNVPSGRTGVFTVHVSRQDGFDGPIDLSLKDAPPGFALQGARVPAGENRIRVTLTAPRRPLFRTVGVRVQGHSRIDKREVTREAAPAEDAMQAFLWRHLVPCQEFLVTALPSRIRTPPPQLLNESPVPIPPRGDVRVRIQVQKGARVDGLELDLVDPPEGVTLEDVDLSEGVLAFTLKGPKERPESHLAGNLIVEAFMERENRGRTQRVSLGVLPAIPYRIR